MEEAKRINYKIYDYQFFVPDEKRIKGLRHYLGYMHHIGKIKLPKEPVSTESAFKSCKVLTEPIKGGMRVVEPT